MVNQMKEPRNLFILTIFIFVLLAGCVTMPGQIKDEYLVNKTQEESDKLEKIEQSIIEKKKEKDQAEDNLKLSEQNLSVNQKKLSVLEKEETLLSEEGKLYDMKNDPEGKKKNEARINAKQKEILMQKLHVDYREAFRNNDKSILELKQTELAVYVAELNFEKAKIAEAYLEKKRAEQKKNQPDKKEEKNFIDKIFGEKEGEKIDVKKYEEYLKSKQEELAKKQKEQAETQGKVNQALTILKNAGFKGEL